jgi:hypothetical protein
MSKLTVDSVTAKKLREVNGRVEIRNEVGELIGYFTPLVDRRLYGSLEIPISEEELRRRAQKAVGRTTEIPFSTEEVKRFASEPGGRSLAEILADLENQS